jgi:glycosyltransferase involved in cell wall biosynthesis
MKENVKSTIDVVIPCYNYARYLRGCVNSVLSQSDVNVRVLVIDDASTDDTPIVGKELAASHSAVQFRRHEQNKGHIATYNEGLLEWSTGDYVVLLSADDILTPGSLGRAISVMEADKRIGMVYGRAVHFTREEDLPEVDGRNFTYTRWSGKEWLLRRCQTGKNVITSPEVVVRGSVQRLVGGYRPELPHAGDLEMWMRIAAVSDVAYIRVPQAFYRVHPGSMMRTVYRESLIDLQQRRAVFDAFFELHRSVVPNADRLHKDVLRTLAREALWDACRGYDRDQLEVFNADELESFALSTYPAATSLPEYAALRRRRLLGSKFCNRTQIFAGPAILKKMGRWAMKRRWQRSGV